jgi:hypothetical protein
METSSFSPKIVIAAVALVTAHSAQALNPHPRLLLDPAELAVIKQKAAANDPDWLSVKAKADSLSKQPILTLTISGATNSNPVQFTTVETIPWTGSPTVLYMGGGTGAWTGVNTQTNHYLAGTRTGTNTFTVPVDATAFGAYTGQNITVFLESALVSNSICYNYEGAGWYDAFRYLGLAYAVTNNSVYATKALQLIDHINSLTAAGIVSPEAADSGYPSRYAALGLALGFDWFYNSLSAAQKAATSATLNYWYDWYVTSAYLNTPHPEGNYWGGHQVGFGAAGLATLGDNPRGQEIIDRMRSQWDSSVPEAFTAPNGNMSGGYPIESFQYGANHMMRLIEYMLFQKTANNEDLLSSTDWTQRIARNQLYSLKPDRWRTTSDGDWSGSYTGVMPQQLSLILSHVLQGQPEGAWMQFYYQNFAAGPKGLYGYQLADAPDRLMFYQASRTATDYRLTEPPYYYSNGDGHTIWRTDWTDNALWSAFLASPASFTAGHQGRAAGGLEIQRGSDLLLINAQQWKGNTGWSGSPESFTTTSDMASTLFFDDLGDYLRTGAQYLGGQQFTGKPNVPVSALTPNYAYVSANLSSAYESPTPVASKRTLLYFYRTFIAMRDGVYLTLDRVSALKNTYTKELRFHLNPVNGAPVQTGNIVSSVVGTSQLYLNPVFPSTASVKVAQNTGGAPTYRAEITDAAGGANMDVLTMMYATGAGTALPPTSMLTTIDSNFYGVEVADPIGPKVMVLAKNSGSGTTYTTTSFTTAAAGTESILVANLSPGVYVVKKNGTVLSGYNAASVGTGGTLFINSTAGSFTVTQSVSGIQISCDINGDGRVDKSDVDIAIQQVLGTAACGSGDLDLNGTCNVVDVQRVINAAAGGVCKIGP